MSSQTADGDEVLPFDNSDVREGVGRVERIVALSGYTAARWVTDDGRCGRCGYDRGDHVTHTEVEAGSVECRNCGHVVHRWE